MARQSPTVIVNVGLIEDDLTISALSPVALIDIPSVVPRNHHKNTAISATIAPTISSLYQSPMTPLPIVSLPMEKMVSHPKRLVRDENPITAILMVYKPVLTIIPARIDSTPSLVCKNAVQNPAKTPDISAAKKARNG